VKNLKYSINWFLPIFIVFAQYNIVLNYSLGIILIFILSIIDLIKYKTISINKEVVTLIVVFILIQLIFHKSSIGIPSFLIVLLSIIVLSDKIDEAQLYKYFKIFGTIAMLGMLYHSLRFYVFGLESNPIQIFPRFGDNPDLNWYEGSRPTSFFSEPQAYASYMMPFLFLSLRKREVIWAITITMSVFLSTSSLGILMMLILWFGYVFFEVKKIKTRISIFSVLSVFTLLLIYSSTFEFSRNKILETAFIGNPRISRGFEVYSVLNPKQMLIGVGYGDLGNFVYTIKENFIWGIGNESRASLGYFTGISGIMIQFGLLGLIILITMFYKLWKKSKGFNRNFLFMIFACFFFQNLILNPYFIYFFIFFLGINKSSDFPIKKIRFKT